MDNLNKRHSHKTKFTKSHLEDASNNLLHGGKKFANELYEDSLDKMHQAEKHVKEYSDDMLLKIKDNPITSLLIAAGVGFLLSSLMKK